MTEVLDKHIVKALVDIIVFLEFTDSDLLDEDIAINAIENLSSELQQMSNGAMENFIYHLDAIATQYNDESQAIFIRNLPENLGLI